MFTFEKLRRALLQGAIFFAAMWIVRDLLAGIGIDRLKPYFFMSILFAAFSLPMNHLLDSFARKMRGIGRPPTVRKTMGEVDRIVHGRDQMDGRSSKN